MNALLIAFGLIILGLIVDRLLDYWGRFNKHSDSSKESLPAFSRKWSRLFNHSSDKTQSKSNSTHSSQTITLMLKPARGQFFSGKELKQAFVSCSLLAGEDGFMYKTHGIKPIYSVCHLYQPGTFSYHHLEHTSYSGCLFILCLEEHAEPLNCFELMLEDFQKMSRLLKAQSLDENGEPLSLSNLNYIRQSIHTSLSVEARLDA